MTYTAIRHTTKSGKSSSNYNVVDYDGIVIGCCTSRKSALTLLERLNNHESILAELEERYSTTITEVDWGAQESCNAYYEVSFQEVRRNDVTQRSDGRDDYWQDISGAGLCESLCVTETRGLCETTERVRADISINSTSSITEVKELPVLDGLAISETRFEVPVITSREQFKEHLNFAIRATNMFAENCFGLATDSRQLATDSRQLATNCLQIAEAAVGVASGCVSEFRGVPQQLLDEPYIDITLQTVQI
jgi:hypothetical protein